MYLLDGNSLSKFTNLCSSLSVISKNRFALLLKRLRYLFSITSTCMWCDVMWCSFEMDVFMPLMYRSFRIIRYTPYISRRYKSETNIYGIFVSDTIYTYHHHQWQLKQCVILVNQRQSNILILLLGYICIQLIFFSHVFIWWDNVWNNVWR